MYFFVESVVGMVINANYFHGMLVGAFCAHRARTQSVLTRSKWQFQNSFIRILGSVW